MKKIFTTLAVISAMFFVVPAFACSQEKAEVITGGACSIKELNNLEKEKTVKKNFLPLGERDLRPVKERPVMPLSDDDCLFGMCLYRTILERESR